jgi:hypothetical protein
MNYREVANDLTTTKDQDQITKFIKKFDEEIITTDDTGMKIDVDYLSLIIESDNPQGERLLAEFQSLKEDFIKHK